MRGKYKFEKFKDINFPVYSSSQKGEGRLVIPHYHEGAELIKITEGSAEIVINTEKFSCVKGDIIFIPPYCIHNLNGQTENTEIRGMVFDLSLISPGISGLSAGDILNKDKISDYVISKENNLYEELNESFLQAVKIYFADRATYKLEMLSALLKVTALLINNYSGGFVVENYDRLQPVFDYIGENFERNIRLSQLSSIINVCDDHLIRLFKSATNKSPVKYINDLRLQEVMKLLINTDLSVTEIAYKTGFCDANYMTRIFKSNLGVTPGQYRKKSK